MSRHPHDTGDCWPSQCPSCWREEELAEQEALEAGEEDET